MAFYEIDTLRTAAAGRWAGILISAGIPAKVLDGRSHPCPKCGGSDRFSAFRDLEARGAVHCRHCFTRGCAIPPGDGIATVRWWLNLSFPEALQFVADALGVPATDSARPRSFPARTHSVPAWQRSVDQDPAEIEAHTAFARAAYRRMDAATRSRLAGRLFVSEASLDGLRVGLSPDGSCSTWPMRDHSGDVIGVRLIGLPWTESAGMKGSRRGSRSGVFMPHPRRRKRSKGNERTRSGRQVGRLYVTEGASDTAAAITLGLWAIGRASCSASSHFIARYLDEQRPTSLTLIADRDRAGRNGAKRLAKGMCDVLPETLHEVEIIVPPAPHNDLRDWIEEGIDRADVESAQSIATYRLPRQTTFDFQ